MLRLATQVTTSPTASARSWSATSATARTSGPRAPKRVTISSSPSSWPRATPARTSATAPPARRAVPVGVGPSGRTRPRSDGRRLRPARAPGRRGRGPRRRSGRGRRSAWPGRASARVEGELGVDGEPGGEGEPGRLGGGPEDVEGGPGPLGVDVVDGDRRDAAPVVDAGVEERRRGRRRGWAGPGRGRRRAGRAGPRRWSRPAPRGGRAGRRAWPCPAWAGSSGRSPPGRGRGGGGRRRWPAGSRGGPARDSPMPTRRPVVKGMASSPAASRVASRRSGVLSGAPRWQARSGSSDSSIIPWLADTARRRARSSGRGRRRWRGGAGPVSSRTRAHTATR